jgi:lipoate-protein ligase A
MQGHSASSTGRLALLPSLELGGAWQMAIDAWMLEQRRPLLRLYRWSRATLSLGRHQRSLAPAWLELARTGRIDLVRRPSGGRAVLHGGDLTYALVWPDAAGSRVQVYHQACGWLREAFAALGQPLRFGRQAAGEQPASCFALNTAADLVHADGAKRIGSAQHWRNGCLLQHGSIQLEPPAALWRELFGLEAPRLPALPVGREALVEILLASAGRWLPLAAEGLQPVALGADALEGIRAGVGRFQVDLASPEASIERTTPARASPRG